MFKHLGWYGTAVLAFAVTDLHAGAIAPGQYYTDAAGISNNNTDFGYAVNDDNVFQPVALGFSFTLFGLDYTDFTISNNGNVQFGSASTSFSPVPLDVQTDGRMIAPYWSDLDSRNDPLRLASVYLAKYANEAIITWESIGEYPADYTNRVSFQLVIRGPGYAVPAGEGVIGFSYKTIGWGSGSGSPPAGTHSASAGFGDGLVAVSLGEVSYLTAANPTSSPEPGTWMMLGAGIGAIGLGRLRARR